MLAEPYLSHFARHSSLKGVTSLQLSGQVPRPSSRELSGLPSQTLMHSPAGWGAQEAPVLELGSATHATVGSAGPSLGAYPLLQEPVHTEPAGMSQHSLGSFPFSRLAVGGPRQAGPLMHLPLKVLGSQSAAPPQNIEGDPCAPLRQVAVHLSMKGVDSQQLLGHWELVSSSSFGGTPVHTRMHSPIGGSHWPFLHTAVGPGLVEV